MPGQVEEYVLVMPTGAPEPGTFQSAMAEFGFERLPWWPDQLAEQAVVGQATSGARGDRAGGGSGVRPGRATQLIETHRTWRLAAPEMSGLDAGTPISRARSAIDARLSFSGLYTVSGAEARIPAAGRGERAGTLQPAR